MNVLYDFQTFVEQEYGGISRYFFEIMSRLHKIDTLKVSLPFLYTNNVHYDKLGNFPSSHFLKGIHFKGKRKLQFTVNRIIAEKRLRQHNYNIFHPTYYDPYFMDELNNIPFVVTVYDLIYKLFKNDHPKAGLIIQGMDAIIPRAHKIIAISNSTKEDLMRIYNLDSSKISVIHLGYSSSNQSLRPGQIVLPKAYMLYVGKRAGYKNFRFMLETIADQLLSKNLHLVCAGGDRFSTDEQHFIKSLDLANRVHYVPITQDEDLPALYKDATLYILPSQYEGFGLTVLEAFSCGCPVVASNSSSIPEVAEQGALYFEPDNKESLRSCLGEILHSTNLQDQLRRQGFEELKRFSWQKTAEETKDVYYSLL
jgi:glycosyltransferase involved in cell wall biosynthesis